MVGCTVVASPPPEPSLTQEATGGQPAETLPPPEDAPTQISDGGARDGASGVASIGENGTFIYIVAEGDVPIEIAARFGLESLGQIENAEGLRVGDNIPIITGETLVILPSV